MRQANSVKLNFPIVDPHIHQWDSCPEHNIYASNFPMDKFNNSLR